MAGIAVKSPSRKGLGQWGGGGRGKAQNEAEAGQPRWFPRAQWPPGPPLMPGGPSPCLARWEDESNSLYVDIHEHVTQFPG